jgi:hypothetical protein
MYFLLGSGYLALTIPLKEISLVHASLCDCEKNILLYLHWKQINIKRNIISNKADFSVEFIL